MASNAISEFIDDFVFCQICWEDLKDPRMLPCLHTFCRPCLERLLATEPVGELSCPTCLQDAPLRQNGVPWLPSMFFVGILQQLSQRPEGTEGTTREDGAPCTVYDDGHPAKFYCVECADYMCQKCNRAHRRDKLKRFHKVETFQDLQGAFSMLCSSGIKQVRPKAEIGNRDSSLKHIKTVSSRGSGSGQFSKPSSLAVIPEGDIVVTDHDNKRLQFLSKDGSFTKTVDLVFKPESVAVLTNGELLVTGDGHRIHVLDKHGKELRVIHVTGAAEEGKTTKGIAADSLGRIIVTIGYQVFALSQSGDILMNFGDKGHGQQQLSSNLRPTVNSRDQIIISDCKNHNLKMFNQDGHHLFTFASRGSGPCQLRYPYCVITDSVDKIIVADNWNDRVSLFSPNGTFIRHVLPREEHGLMAPMGLALTNDGHLIVTDVQHITFFLSTKQNQEDITVPGYLNYSVRHIETVGKMGSGEGEFHTPSSLAVTAEGRIIVTDHENTRLQFLHKDGSFKNKVDLGFKPECVAVLTNGELLVTGDGHRIHVLDKHGKELRVIQVTGATEHRQTTKGIVDDSMGRNIVTIGYQVFVLSPSGDVMLKFGDKGQGQQQLSSDLRVTVNSRDHIIISDYDNHGLKIFDPDGRHLVTCGSPGRGHGQLRYPYCVLTDNEDNIIVAGYWNNRVSLFSRDGTFIRHMLTREEHGLTKPRGLALSNDGHLIVTDAHCIKFFLLDKMIQEQTSDEKSAEKAGQTRRSIQYAQQIMEARPKVEINIVGAGLKLINTVGKNGSGEGQFDYPCSLAFTTEGDMIVADCVNSRLQFLNKDGSTTKKVELGFKPESVAVLTNGELLVTGDGHRIHVLDKHGKESRVIQVTGAAEEGQTTKGIAVDSLGRIIVTIGYQVFVLSPSGDVMLKFGDKGQGQWELSSNLRLTVNMSDQIIISDFSNHNVKMFNPVAGRHLFTFGSHGSGPGQLNGPYCAITDSKDNILVADYGNQRVSLFSRDGTFIGHVLTREEDELYWPMGLILTHNKRLIISDEHSIKFFLLNEKIPEQTSDEKMKEKDELAKDLMNLTFDPLAADVEQDVPAPVGGIKQMRRHIAYAPHTTQVRPLVAMSNYRLECVRTVRGPRGNGDGQFDWPCSLAATADGDIVVTDCFNSRLQILDRDGAFKKEVDLGFKPFCAVALTNDELLVTGDGHRIHVVDKHGRESRVIQVTGAAEEGQTTKGIAVDSLGRIIVTVGYQVFVLSPSGGILINFGDKGQGQKKLSSDLRLTVNSSNQIIVSDLCNENLKIFDPVGRHLFTSRSRGSGPGQLSRPYCVITDSEDNILVAEHGSCRISLFSRYGAFSEHLLLKGRPLGLTLSQDGHFVVSYDNYYSCDNSIEFFLFSEK